MRLEQKGRNARALCKLEASGFCCRFDSEKAGDREVQRTMLELLNQLDGFEPNNEIKVSFQIDVDYKNKFVESITSRFLNSFLQLNKLSNLKNDKLFKPLKISEGGY